MTAPNYQSVKRQITELLMKTPSHTLQSGITGHGSEPPPRLQGFHEYPPVTESLFVFADGDLEQQWH